MSKEALRDIALAYNNNGDDTDHYTSTLAENPSKVADRIARRKHLAVGE